MSIVERLLACLIRPLLYYKIKYKNLINLNSFSAVTRQHYAKKNNKKVHAGFRNHEGAQKSTVFR